MPLVKNSRASYPGFSPEKFVSMGLNPHPFQIGRLSPHFSNNINLMQFVVHLPNTARVVKYGLYTHVCASSTGKLVLDPSQFSGHFKELEDFTPAGMRFLHRSVDFRLFWTKPIISEIYANPLTSQNAYIWGWGDTQIVPEYGGAHIWGQFSAFFYQHPLSSLLLTNSGGVHTVGSVQTAYFIPTILTSPW